MNTRRQPLGLKNLRLLVRERHGMDLADYVFARHDRDPDLTIDALGSEFGIERDTWRRYLKRIDIGIGSGPRLVDLRIRTKQAALSEAARLIDEMEADEAPASAT